MGQQDSNRQEGTDHRGDRCPGHSHFHWKYKNINTEYMYYYLSTVNIESFGCRAAKGITLNNDSLNSIVVKIPSISEQNKIANALIMLDGKIEKEQEKLDSLNEYKKGLLQQMFV